MAKDAKSGQRPAEKIADKAAAAFMRKVFPKGTVFRMKRNRYAKGKLYRKGTTTAPLAKAGPPPSPAYEVHHIPSGEEPTDPDTMSRVQQGAGRTRPPGA